jgi:methyl-accepting chemotaxis protein
MGDINESSKKISDIISVIDEIAFQTNLLALNAAVEAARAGEQGRGFAVVATEVRSLAGRSATAAKEIKELIQDSVRKVEDGSLLVTQSGQTLEQIVLSVKKVSDIVAEIAAASREQSSGIEQVNKAVMQMDEMTQQNAALVEQATAASQSMADQARDLTKMMERYQVGELSGSGSSASKSAPASKVAPTSKVAPVVERRSPSRPLSGKPAARPAPVESHEAPVARPKAVASGGDADWREF